MSDDNNPSITSATGTATAGKERVRRSGLIVNGVAGLLGLTWKLVTLPVAVAGASVGIVTGSIRLGFRVAGRFLSCSLSIIGRIHREWSPIRRVSASEMAARSPEAIDFLPEFENRCGISGNNQESSPEMISPVRVSDDESGQSISLLRQFEGPASLEEMLIEEEDAVYEADQVCSDITVKEHQQKEAQNQLEKEAALAKLRDEKASSLGPEPEKGPDVTQVLVRLPNGERKGRRFHCRATLQSLYDYVDSSGCLEEGSYTLVTFFPRVLYGPDELSSTLEELGLYPLASLFVELTM